MNQAIPIEIERIWGDCGLDIPATKSDPEYSKNPASELTDGQISIALDKDLLSLLDGLAQELSIPSTTTSSAPSANQSVRINSFASLPHPESSRTYNDVFSLIHNSYGVIESSPNQLKYPIDRNGARVPKGDGSKEQSSIVNQHNALPKQTYFGARELSTVSHRNLRESSVGSFSSAKHSGIIAETDPLPQVLHALDNENDDTIVVVRRITRLGFKSNRILKSVFEQLGWPVKTVVLLPSRSRPVESGEFIAPHSRPSSMGFVVFNSPSSASECISRGSIDVQGVDILVHPFVRQYKPSSGVERQKSS
jgi:hypothetical protein